MLFRIMLVYFGFRLGGILMGTPMVVFPLLAMQAWLGPPVTQDQTIGSVASITAIALGLWSLWLPVNISPLLAILTMASAWLLILLVLYATRMPAAAMAAAIVANSAYILDSVSQSSSGRRSECGKDRRSGDSNRRFPSGFLPADPRRSRFRARRLCDASDHAARNHLFRPARDGQ